MINSLLDSCLLVFSPELWPTALGGFLKEKLAADAGRKDSLAAIGARLIESEARFLVGV